jgi:hypothetical protein
MAQRKVWIIEVLVGKRWEMTTFGSMYWDTRAIMLEELVSARSQYPDTKYKLTTYVPKEPVAKSSKKKKKKPTRRKR